MEFDIIVIGGGPGGYPCAIKASQLGYKVASIDKNEMLGGTCLRQGCIPSKALLHSSHLYKESENLSKFGLSGNITFEIDRVMAYKEAQIKTLAGGIEGLYKKNKIERIKASASIKGKEGDKFIVETDGGAVLKAKNLVIATGSTYSVPPQIKIDETDICSSTGALSWTKVPEKLVVIGAGAIGLELASVWARFGSKVTIVEYLDRIAYAMDMDVSKDLHRSLNKQGIEIKVNTELKTIKKQQGKIVLEIKDRASEVTEELKADKVLVATGRKPYTDGLGLESLGIAKDSKGYIVVDENFSTNMTNVYAIGDVIQGPMLAHKASDEGVAVAEIIQGQKPVIYHELIPSVIYTHPEAASIGKTEQQLKAEGKEYKVGKFPFLANSRAKIMAETEGFVKVICDKNGKVLGIHVLGFGGFVINEASVAMTYGASAEDIARIIHSHPDINEALKEAAMAAYSKPIHI